MIVCKLPRLLKEMSDMISDKHWVKWSLDSYLKKSYKGYFLVKFKQRKFMTT